MTADPRFHYYYPAADDSARYVAEMIGLAPTPIADKFTVHENGANHAYYMVPGVDNRFGADAIAAATADLADAVAAYAAAHAPKWTFQYDPDCTEDLACVRAIRDLPPPVGIAFAVSGVMTARLGCLLYDATTPPLYRGQEARNELLSAMAARQAQLFPMRQHAACDLEVVIGCDFCMRKRCERDVLALRHAGAQAVMSTARWPAAVTTLWHGASVWYGDGPVAAQLAKLAAAAVATPTAGAPRVWWGDTAGVMDSRGPTRMIAKTRGYNQEDTCCFTEHDTVVVEGLRAAATATECTPVAVSDPAPERASIVASEAKAEPDIARAYFTRARAALFATPPVGYSSVRFLMEVHDTVRAAYLAQLDALPSEWRARISTVFVADRCGSCVDYWHSDAASAAALASFGIATPLKVADIMQLLLA